MGKSHVGNLPDVNLYIGQVVHCGGFPDFDGLAHIVRFVGDWVVVQPISCRGRQYPSCRLEQYLMRNRVVPVADDELALVDNSSDII